MSQNNLFQKGEITFIIFRDKDQGPISILKTAAKMFQNEFSWSAAIMLY